MTIGLRKTVVISNRSNMQNGSTITKAYSRWWVPNNRPAMTEVRSSAILMDTIAIVSYRLQRNIQQLKILSKLLVN